MTEKADFDLIHFVTHPTASGVSWGRKICTPNKGWRSAISRAYGQYECNGHNPPTEIRCTVANRIILTAPVGLEFLNFYDYFKEFVLRSTNSLRVSVFFCVFRQLRTR